MPVGLRLPGSRAHTRYAADSLTRATASAGHERARGRDAGAAHQAVREVVGGVDAPPGARVRVRRKLYPVCDQVKHVVVLVLHVLPHPAAHARARLAALDCPRWRRREAARWPSPHRTLWPHAWHRPLAARSSAMRRVIGLPDHYMCQRRIPQIAGSACILSSGLRTGAQRADQRTAAWQSPRRAGRAACR